MKYSNFFNLHLLIRKIPEDKKNDKSRKHLINVIKDYRKQMYEMDIIYVN